MSDAVHPDQSRLGPSWYRDYFEDGLTQAEVEAPLKKFGAKAVVVGHTPQWRAKKLYQGKVLAIGVKHPRDYRGSIPPRSSDGLLIQDADSGRKLQRRALCNQWIAGESCH